MTITLTREEAQQVLDSLTWCYDVTEWPANGSTPQDKAIETLRARLSAPEPEPVAYMDREGRLFNNTTHPEKNIPLYTAPPQSEPPCKTGSQCIGGKCPQCVAPEPAGYVYEDDEGRMMFSQMPTGGLFWEPVYRKNKGTK